MMPIGIMRAMPRQFCQRWNWTRLSEPISQTKRAPLQRALSAVSV
jgi:hypothetical protein